MAVTIAEVEYSAKTVAVAFSVTGESDILDAGTLRPVDEVSTEIDLDPDNPRMDVLAVARRQLSEQWKKMAGSLRLRHVQFPNEDNPRWRVSFAVGVRYRINIAVPFEDMREHFQRHGMDGVVEAGRSLAMERVQGFAATVAQAQPYARLDPVSPSE